MDYLDIMKNKMTPRGKSGLKANINIVGYYISNHRIYLRLDGDIYDDNILANDVLLIEKVQSIRTPKLHDTISEDQHNYFFSYFYEGIVLEKSEFLDLVKRIFKDDIVSPNSNLNIKINQMIYYFESEDTEENLNEGIKAWNRDFSNYLYNIVFHNTSLYPRVNVIFGYNEITTKLTNIEFESLSTAKAPAISLNDFKFSNDEYDTYYNIFEDSDRLDLTGNVIVHNVGQANFVEINAYNNSIACDIGIGNDLSKKAKDSVGDYLKKGIFDAYVITHLHWDHYCGYTYLSNEAKFRDWYLSIDKYTEATGLKGRSLRFISDLLLHSTSNIHIFKAPKHKTIWSYNISKYLTAYLGNYPKNDIKAINYNGLILKLNYSGKIALFTGDCNYEFIPSNALRNKVNLLVAPHHGAKQGNLANYSLVNPGANATVVISVGRNTYGHPTVEHIYNLTKQGFKLISTLDSGSIRYDLSTGDITEFDEF